MLAGRLVSRAPLGAAAVNSLSSTIRSFSGLYGTVDSTPRRCVKPGTCSQAVAYIPSLPASLSATLRGAMQAQSVRL